MPWAPRIDTIQLNYLHLHQEELQHNCSPNIPSIFFNLIWTNSFHKPSVNFAIYTKGYHLVNHSYTGVIPSSSIIHIRKAHDWATRQLSEGRIIKGASYLESIKKMFYHLMGNCRQTFQILQLKTHFYVGWGQAQIMCHLKLISGGSKQHFSWIKEFSLVWIKGC